AAGTVTYSAAAPGRSNPTRPYTFSPGCQPLAPRPTAATTPDKSWHGMAGQVSGQVSSAAVTAVARTSTSSSPGAGSGTGTLWQVRLAGSGPPASTARIVWAGLVTGHLHWSFQCRGSAPKGARRAPGTRTGRCRAGSPR